MSFWCDRKAGRDTSSSVNAATAPVGSCTAATIQASPSERADSSSDRTVSGVKTKSVKSASPNGASFMAFFAAVYPASSSSGTWSVHVSTR